MDASSLPSWIQGAGTIAVAIVAAVIGVFKYLKTQEKTDAQSSSGSLVSASFIDSKLIKELIEVVREHQEEVGRDAKRALRASQDVREAIQENTEATVVQTDSTSNLLKFLTRMTPRSERIVNVTED